MILFIEKTWFLWWMLTIIVAVRCFHLLSVRARVEGPDGLGPQEEEEA